MEYGGSARVKKAGIQLKSVASSFKLFQTFQLADLFCGFFFSLQMIARGKNASDLFPAVVKNVACKNIEVCNELHVAPCATCCTACSFSSAYFPFLWRKKSFSLHHSLTPVCTTCKLRLIFSLLYKKKPQKTRGVWLYLTWTELQFSTHLFKVVITLLYLLWLVYLSGNNWTNLHNLD